LAADGYRVAVNYSTRVDAAQEVVAAIVASGGTAIAVGADVGDAAAVEAMFATVESAFGSVEVLVNNAGITRDGLLMRMSEADWSDVLVTNLSSVYLCSRRAMKGMVRARWGRIISVSSVSGIAGNPGQANYAASKAGIIGFSKSVSKEVGSRNITVNVVAPGFIETDMTDALGEGAISTVTGSIAVGRLGTTQEVASAVGYLASPEAAYITGHVLVVDGGIAL
jgi:3-oxoacyl-[acyl-carrier protein] reductase